MDQFSRDHTAYNRFVSRRDNHDAMMARCLTRSNIPGEAYYESGEEDTSRYNFVHRERNIFFRLFFLIFLPHFSQARSGLTPRRNLRCRSLRSPTAKFYYLAVQWGHHDVNSYGCVKSATCRSHNRFLIHLGPRDPLQGDPGL